MWLTLATLRRKQPEQQETPLHRHRHRVRAGVPCKARGPLGAEPLQFPGGAGVMVSEWSEAQGASVVGIQGWR